MGPQAVRKRTQRVHGSSKAGSAEAVPGGPSDAVRELCHDLRQPLATILALVGAAETEADLPAAVKQRLEQIAAESVRMRDMVTHVLEDTLAFEPHDPGAAMKEIVDWTRITYRGRIDFYTLGEDDELLVIADRVLLRRGLSNLIENAVRAAGPDGSIAVSVGRQGDWVVIDVSDSGDGQGPPQGTGLGLRIVERLTRTHGGDVAFHRAALGGVLVRLRLRAAEREQSAKSMGRVKE